MKLMAAVAIFIIAVTAGVWTIASSREQARVERSVAAQIPPASECHDVINNFAIYVCVFEFDGGRYLVSNRGGIVRVLK